MYLGYGGRIPWWRWVLVLLALPWYGAEQLWRSIRPRRTDPCDGDPTAGLLDSGSETHLRLLNFEDELANGVFQDSPEIVQGRIHPDFVEVGSSGALVDRQKAIDWILSRRRPGSIQLRDGSVSGLGAGWYLVRYRTFSESGRSTRRMSLWRQEACGEFQIRYHQGTPVGESDQRAP